MSAPSVSIEQRAQQRIGTTIKDKYTLQRVLGVGGMASVYLGVHRNGYRVAVKMLHAELSVMADMRERFVREGYIANAIEHRGAVRVLDNDTTEDGSEFLVMELLEGETLEDRRKRQGGRLSPREVIALGWQLLDVLAAANEQGIVHRDIKPENLFITTDGILKVLDFGIARVLDDLNAPGTRTSRSMGTPEFMPPEQALGHRDQINAFSDIWACSATLFTLLSGRLVHGDDEGRQTSEELLVRTATQPARSLGAVAPELPSSIAGVIDRALRFAQAERWPSARTMQQALENAHVEAYDEPIASAIVPAPASIKDLAASETAPTLLATPPTLPRPARPKRFVAWKLSLIAVTVMAIALLTFWISGRKPPPAAVFPDGWPSCRTHADCGVSGKSVCGPAGRCIARQGCTSHRECTEARDGKPHLCRKDSGACVALESEDCRILAEKDHLANDATLWFGVMFPTHGPEAAIWGQGAVQAVDLARRDFIEITGGLPPGHSGGPLRPMAFVVCNDALEPTRAAEHLVRRLGVPAIIGFARSKEVLDLTASLFNPEGVLALASNTASMLSSIPAPEGQPRLVWRTTTSVGITAAPQVALVSDVLEPELRAIPGLLGRDDPIRVAFIRINNTSGLSYADVFVSTLHFNGKSVVQNGEAFRLRRIHRRLPAHHNVTKERKASLTENLISESAFSPSIYRRPPL